MPGRTTTSSLSHTEGFRVGQARTARGRSLPCPVHRAGSLVRDLPRARRRPLGVRGSSPVGENVRGLLRQPDIANSLLSDEGLALVAAFVRWIGANPDVATRRLHEEVDARDLASFDTLLASAGFASSTMSSARTPPMSPKKSVPGCRRSLRHTAGARSGLRLSLRPRSGAGVMLEARPSRIVKAPRLYFLYQNELTGNVPSSLRSRRPRRHSLLGPSYRNRVSPSRLRSPAPSPRCLHNRRNAHRGVQAAPRGRIVLGCVEPHVCLAAVCGSRGCHPTNARRSSSIGISSVISTLSPSTSSRHHQPLIALLSDTSSRRPHPRKR